MTTPITLTLMVVPDDEQPNPSQLAVQSVNFEFDGLEAWTLTPRQETELLIWLRDLGTWAQDGLNGGEIQKVTTVGVAIPSIPIRGDKLQRAIASVSLQTRPVDAISVAIDTKREGAWTTRNRAMWGLMGGEKIDWVAFLDDDDELLPQHVEHLLACAEEHKAGMVWGWFDVVGGIDPFPADFRGRQYDLDHVHCIPITYMVRTDLLWDAWQLSGGFQPDTTGNWTVQDRPLIDAVHEAMQRRGMWSYASPETTWLWHHWGSGSQGIPGNTSGQPERWIW